MQNGSMKGAGAEVGNFLHEEPCLGGQNKICLTVAEKTKICGELS